MPALSRPMRAPGPLQPPGPPMAAQRPVAVPVTAGVLFLAAAALSLLAAGIDATVTLDSINPEWRGYQDFMGAALLRISFSLPAGIFLMAAGILCLLRRAWDAAFGLLLPAAALQGMANVPHTYDEFLNTGSAMLGWMALLLSVFAGVTLASCRRDFGPMGKGGFHRYPGSVFGLREPVVPFFPPGDPRPARYMLMESGREAAGALMLLSGLLLLAGISGILRKAAGQDLSGEEMRGLWLHAGLVAAAAVAALVGGVFSTARKSRFLSAGLGAGATILAGVTTFYFLTPLAETLGITLLMDETLFLQGLSAFIYLLISSATAAATGEADREPAPGPLHGST